MRLTTAGLTLLCTCTLGTAGAETLVGLPLTGGYEVRRGFYAQDQAQFLYREGHIQIVVAEHPSHAKYLLLARDVRTRRTLWKRYGKGEPYLAEVTKGHGAVMVDIMNTGAIMRSSGLLLNLQTGQVLREGRFNVVAVRQGRALILDYDETPPGAAFHSDPQRLTGMVMSLPDGRILTRNIPVPGRSGCGALKPLEVNSDHQVYAFRNSLLVVQRQDSCGSFRVLFEWWKTPLLLARIQQGWP